MLSWLPILLVASALLERVQQSLIDHELKANAVAGALAEEAIAAIRTVVAHDCQSTESRLFGSSLKTSRTVATKRGLITAARLSLLCFLNYATFSLAFWYGIGLVMDSSYNAGSLNISFFTVFYAFLKAGQLSPYLELFSIAKSSAAGIYQIIDRVPTIDSSSHSGQRPPLKGHIRFEKVNFSYPSRVQVPVLKELTMDIPAGRTIALVGSSGCEKSTCVQLLQRFYDPAEGRIIFDGHDVRDLDVSWLRDQIGVVGQEPVLFDLTIAENIRYGSALGSIVTQEDVKRAAEIANADQFIRLLPNGYETLVGERGAQLSGGQKQRIAIARAIVRDPKILLLDEATSALDTRSEVAVQEALDKASQGRTTLIVAYHIAAIRSADLILVLKDGNIEVT